MTKATTMRVVIFLTTSLLIMGGSIASAQQTSALITGTVQDSQGAAVPNATVVLLNQAQGAVFQQLTTGADGRFVFTPVPPSTYTLSVEASGFKKYVKPDMQVFASDRLGLPPIALELGAISETVTVEGTTPQLQTASAERSGLLTGTQMTDLALTGRDWSSLLRTIPGVPPDSTSTINGGRADQNTVMVDGATAVDAGNNGMTLLRINTDAIAEFKAVTNSKQAEFGRSAGANIGMVTKGGTQNFHGTAYWFHRNEGMNANSWINNLQNRPKQLYRYQTYGFNVGGPIYIPNHFNSNKQKLFFFTAVEFQRPLSPNDPRDLTMPTALERQGDFSQTRDAGGVLVPIRDPTTNAQFPGNKIPVSRWDPLGLAVMKWMPTPNIAGNLAYNYETQIPTINKYNDTITRIDYNINDRFKFYFRLLTNSNDGQNPYGALNANNTYGITSFTSKSGGISGMGNLTTILSSTMSNEFIYANTRNYLPVNIPSNSPFLQSNAGFALPLFYSSVDVSKLVPNLEFSGVPSNTASMMDFRSLPYDNENPTTNITDNFSKVSGSHTIKAGIFIEQSLKRQTAESPTNGTYDFKRDAQNPGDTNWDYSNLLLGNFQSFKQGSAFRTGYYHYTTVEWYVQDNWKVRSNLTLDYGLRMAKILPWTDQKNQLSTFFPDLYDPKQSVVLYQKGSVGGKTVAINPLTGAQAAAPLVGAEVPGVGNPFNGMATEGKNGITPYLIDSRGIQWGPRFGLAWTPAGVDGKTVVRAGGGIFYERTMGNMIFYQIPNPPGNTTPQLYYGNFSNVGTSGQVLFPTSVAGMSRDGHLPTTYNYNLSIQRMMPFGLLLDIGYVGSLSRHLINPLPINEPAPGSAWLPQNQDPTVTPKYNGTTSLPIDMTRPYAGYGAIWNYTMGGTSNYNSLQISVNRRVGKRLQFGAFYTWSKALGTASQLYTSSNNPWDTKKADYGPLTFDRTQVLTFNYIYNLPGAPHASFLDNKLGRLILNGWEVSGITSFASGAPTNVSYNIQNVSTLNQLTTGVQDVAPRVRMTCEPNRAPGGDRTMYQWINTGCIAPALAGSWGMDSSLNYLRGPGTNNWDASLYKNIRYTSNESRYIQLRLETYNTLNHTQFSDFNRTATFNAAGQITNLPTGAGGPANNRLGFGALNAVRAARVLQIAAKIYF